MHALSPRCIILPPHMSMIVSSPVSIMVVPFDRRVRSYACWRMDVHLGQMLRNGSLAHSLHRDGLKKIIFQQQSVWVSPIFEIKRKNVRNPVVSLVLWTNRGTKKLFCQLRVISQLYSTHLRKSRVGKRIWSRIHRQGILHVYPKQLTSESRIQCLQLSIHLHCERNDIM